MKTGLISACLDAGVPGMLIVPVPARPYEISVLEDHVLARGQVPAVLGSLTREIARYGGDPVGYRTRAFVNFGRPIALDRFDAESRKLVADLARLIRGEIGRLYKVLPTAVLASAMRRR